MKTILFGIVLILLLNIGHSSTVPLENLEALWLFDENSGSVANDSSGNNYNGSISGAAWSQGKFGNALTFDGLDDSLIINNYYGVGGTNPRTVAFWFKGTAITDHSWVKWGDPDNGEKYFIRAHPITGGAALRVEVSGGQSYGSTNVADGLWHHLAVVFPEGANSVKDHLLYVDGVLEQNPGGGDLAMNRSTDTNKVYIGAPVTGLEQHAFANGSMDEVAIFNTALSQSQIQNILSNGFESSFVNGIGNTSIPEPECFLLFSIVLLFSLIRFRNK